jgi:CBS domain-containing protein
MNILFLLKPKNTVSFIYDDYTLKQGLEKMRLHGYTASPVLSHEGYYVGTVNEGDFLWYFMDNDDHVQEDLEQVRVKDIVRDDWNQPVKVSATVEDLLERVLNQNFVPVVDDRNLFVGIITRRAVIKHFSNRILELKEKVKE